MESEWLRMLMDRLAAALELYARQWCDEPEDVVQEAFVKLTEQAATAFNPAAWLFRTVRHRGQFPGTPYAIELNRSAVGRTASRTCLSTSSATHTPRCLRSPVVPRLCAVLFSTIATQNAGLGLSHPAASLEFLQNAPLAKLFNLHIKQTPCPSRLSSMGLYA